METFNIYKIVQLVHYIKAVPLGFLLLDPSVPFCISSVFRKRKKKHTNYNVQ